MIRYIIEMGTKDDFVAIFIFWPCLFAIVGTAIIMPLVIALIFAIGAACGMGAERFC